MERDTENMKLWLFDLAHNNLSDDAILKGFITHYVLQNCVLGNVQQDIVFHTNYGENGVRNAIENLNRVLNGIVLS